MLRVYWKKKTAEDSNTKKTKHATYCGYEFLLYHDEDDEAVDGNRRKECQEGGCQGESGMSASFQYWSYCFSLVAEPAVGTDGPGVGSRGQSADVMRRSLWPCRRELGSPIFGDALSRTERPVPVCWQRHGVEECAEAAEEELNRLHRCECAEAEFLIGRTVDVVEATSTRRRDKFPPRADGFCDCPCWRLADTRTGVDFPPRADGACD